jgi:uncharacterized protein
MSPVPQNPCIAFNGSTRIAIGTRFDVARAAKAVLDSTPDAALLIFDSVTSEPVEFDLRGSVDDVVARLGEAEPVAEAPAPRSPGRPKLGVVAREVTLLPRHWEWLSAQPGGASVTLRKLVEAARKERGGADRRRAAQEATYRFAIVLAGDEPGFEESTRALYAGDSDRFESLTEPWPADVRDHARALAAEAFATDES